MFESKIFKSQTNNKLFNIITSSADEISLADQWSKDFDWLASSGSDFHGWPNQRVQIGNLADLPSTSRAIWSYL